MFFNHSEINLDVNNTHTNKKCFIYLDIKKYTSKIHGSKIITKWKR